MSELEDREKALKVALMKSESVKVKWPTVDVPRGAFKARRVVKKKQDKAGVRYLDH